MEQENISCTFPGVLTYSSEEKAIEFLQTYVVGESGSLVVAAAGLSWQVRLAVPIVGGLVALLGVIVLLTYLGVELPRE